MDFRFAWGDLEFRGAVSYSAQLEHFGLRDGYPMCATGQVACFDDNMDIILDIACRKIDAGDLNDGGEAFVDLCDVAEPAFHMAA